MAIVTAMLTSFKSELFASAHCFGGPITINGTTHSTDTVDGISSLAGIAVGMTIQEANGDLPSQAIVADISVVAGTIKVYPAATGSHTGTPLTITGDIFKIALIRHAPAGSYGAANVNYSDIGADQVSGTGYTSGGLALTNVAPAISGTTAFVSFGGTTTWTSATIDADGCMIYNSGNRLGGTSGTDTTGTGRAIYVGDFGGRQQVTAGTFTIVMPTADATHALLRLQ